MIDTAGVRAENEDLAPFSEAVNEKHRSQFLHHEDYFRKNYSLATVSDEWLDIFKDAKQAPSEKMIED